ncbi:MAG: hypothetical protein KC486_31940 [Myxococcales bacterium]|nr:hypothetical protein [Myxococcales bacterium]
MIPLTVSEAEAILRVEDPILRNLRITAGYHRLTLGMAEIFGRTDFTWPIFATWASRQAGTFIRKEFIPRTLRPLLDGSLPARGVLGELLAALPGGDEGLIATIDAIADGVSRFVTGGNTIVFDDLGRAFAAFIERFADPAARTPAALADFVAGFSDGEAQPDRVTVGPDGALVIEKTGGEALLRESMTHLFDALHEGDPNRRAELVLMGNAKAGFHEQIRLQPYIANALSGPALDLLRAARAAEAPGAERAVALVRRVVTELMMTMELPGQVLRLGGDLKAGASGALWTRHLDHLDNPDLVALARKLGAYDELDLDDRIEGWFGPLLVRLHLAAAEAQGTGAEDWSSLSDRMRYIFAYFRSRQGDASLLACPFSAPAMAAILDGRIPAEPG